ncbi:MAG: DUF1080 domain-containing protein [Roseibacillus sp.]|nr:DUF1080 domain-containing protein [Roseibacillus sp.]
MKTTTSRYSLAALAFAVVSLASLDAADQNKAWTDSAVAEKEDPDFSIQGEYAVEGLGAQVIALGSGHFQAVLYQGGLPGAGWDGKSKSLLDGKLGDKKSTFVPAAGKKRYMAGGGTEFSATLKFPPEGHKSYRGEISSGTFRVKAENGKSISLKRIVRQSPTVGAKPPKGAVVLFDGTSADGWKNGKVVNGLLAGSNAMSSQKFRDCTIHVEFQTPYKPHARSQGRGNSGVYYMGRWETQVLDSFGLEGLMNECGGIYSIAKSKVNMCLPPLTWQTYDVEYTHAKFDQDGKRTAWPRMTVKLNGVLVQEHQEMGKTHTTAAPVHGPLKNDEGGPIFLQNHGNPVFYRNIWVLPKK